MSTFLLTFAGCSSASTGTFGGGVISGALQSAGRRREPPAGLVTETAKPADAFVDSVGVATHLSYDDTAYYKRWPEVFSLLRSSGIRHLRDGFYDWDASSAFVKEHQALAAAGIHTTYVIPFDRKTEIDGIERFSRRVKDLEAIEAPNECNAGQNCGGGKKAGTANAASFQQMLMEAGQLLHVPVLGPSFTEQEAYATIGDLSRKMTSNNLHIYFGGRNPGTHGWGGGDSNGHNYGSLDWWIDQGRLDGGDLPSSITETGYMMPEVPRPYTIPPALGASYLPRTLLLAFNRGISRTFIYELLDEGSSPDYGLLTSDLAPKPAFTAVSNLLHLFADPGPRFRPGLLTYCIHGEAAEMAHTLLQKRDGSFWLIIWRERSDYDPASNKETALPDSNVVLSLGTNFAVKRILRFNDAGVVSNERFEDQPAGVPLPFDGHLTVVQISAKSKAPN